MYRVPVGSDRSESSVTVHCIRAVRVSRIVKFGRSICLGVTKLQSISQKMVSMDPRPDPAAF